MVARLLWFAGGWVAVTLGVIGIVLPLLPTTPFMILAAYCFALSSERWHNWLLNHRVFGPIIRDWLRHKAMRRSVKRRVQWLIVLTFSLSIYIVEPWLLKLFLLSLAAIMLLWLRRIPVL